MFKLGQLVRVTEQGGVSATGRVADRPKDGMVSVRLHFEREPRLFPIEHVHGLS